MEAVFKIILKIKYLWFLKYSHVVNFALCLKIYTMENFVFIIQLNTQQLFIFDIEKHCIHLMITVHCTLRKEIKISFYAGVLFPSPKPWKEDHFAFLSTSH